MQAIYQLIALDMLPDWRTPVWQLSHLRLSSYKGTLPSQLHWTSVHAGRVSRHRLSHVRRVHYRPARPSAGVGRAPVYHVPSRHSLWVQRTSPVTCPLVRHSMRAHHKPVQRKDICISLVLVRFSFPREYLKHAQVALPSALLARSGALCQAAAPGCWRDAPRAWYARQVHGKLSQAWWIVHRPTDRDEYGRGRSRGGTVWPLEQLQSGAETYCGESRA